MSSWLLWGCSSLDHSSSRMGLSWVASNMKIQTSAVVFWPVIHVALAVGDDSTAIPSVYWLLLPDKTSESFLLSCTLSSLYVWRQWGNGVFTDTLMVIRAVFLLFNPDFSASLCLTSSMWPHTACALREMTSLGTIEFLPRLPWAVDTGLLMHPADGSHAFLSRLWYNSTLRWELPIQLLGNKLMWADGEPLVIWWQHIPKLCCCLSVPWCVMVSGMSEVVVLWCLKRAVDWLNLLMQQKGLKCSPESKDAKFIYFLIRTPHCCGSALIILNLDATCWFLSLHCSREEPSTSL